MFISGKLRISAFPAYAVILSIALLRMSRNIAILNQGDFARVIGFMLGDPVDIRPYNGYVRPAFLWAYLPHIGSPLRDHNSASLYFWIASWFERLIEINFDLFLVATVSKVITLLCCYRLTARLCLLLGLDGWARFPTFAFLAIAFFYAHTVELLNSFYAEHVFIVGIAILITGLCEKQGRLRIPGTALGMLLISTAKPQYFYLPILLVCILMLASLGPRKVDYLTCILLAGIQVISFASLEHADTVNVNRYHALFFGAYELLPRADLKALNVPGDCIGVDAWGWKIVGPLSTDIGRGPDDCFGRFHGTTMDLLMVYMHHPTLIFRLARWALPNHLTVRYFQVLPRLLYMQPSDGSSYHSGTTLIVASNIREAVVTRWWFVFLFVGVLMPFWPGIFRYEMVTSSLFLALTFATQIAVCLVGEGVRDLSKHLAGAELCLDLLVSFEVVQVLSVITTRRWQSRNREHSDELLANASSSDRHET